MSETLIVHDLEFEVRRSQRRKTLGLTVDRFGALVVHAPQRSGIDELRRWVEKKMLSEVVPDWELRKNDLAVAKAELVWTLLRAKKTALCQNWSGQLDIPP